MHHVGFEINKILDSDISKEKSKVFKELDVDSLNKVSKYCYANSCGRCNKTDCCYYYIIINYVHKEFRERRKRSEYSTCHILNSGRDENCGCFACDKIYPLHPSLNSEGVTAMCSNKDDTIRYYGCAKHCFPFMVYFPPKESSSSCNDKL